MHNTRYGNAACDTETAIDESMWGSTGQKI